MLSFFSGFTIILREFEELGVQVHLFFIGWSIRLDRRFLSQTFLIGSDDFPIIGRTLLYHILLCSARI